MGKAPCQEGENRGGLPTQPELVNHDSIPNRCTTDYGNDPAAAIKTTILRFDGYEFQSEVNSGCRGFVASVVVRDSERGREIEVEEAQSGPLLRTVAKARRPVALSGISKSMLPEHCGVAVLWDTQN